MARNFDVGTLRSFVHIADTGSVSRAAQRVNMTQSAVSMQIKRLEEAINAKLFNRGTGGMALTPTGEQLLSYARNLVDLNDSAYNRLTASDYEGLVRIGLPTDICTLTFPDALRAFKQKYPRAKVSINTSLTPMLKQGFEGGEYDIILVTEQPLDPAATLLRTENLAWVGAPGGSAYQRRPLPIGISPHCAFRGPMLAALDSANIGWEDVNRTEEYSSFLIELMADLCVDVELESVAKARGQVLDHRDTLPVLPKFSTGMLMNSYNHLIDALAEHIILAYK